MKHHQSRFSGEPAPADWRRSREHGLSFRLLTDRDMAFLKSVYRSTREDELSRTGWSEIEKQNFIDLQFRAQHEHYQTHYPEALWLIVEKSGEAIGRLYLERWSEQHRIIDIALLPQHRGIGLGALIMRDLMDEAADAGKAVSIHVEKFNPAMRLYDRLGFVPVEDKGVYDLMEWRAGPLK